MTSAGPSIKDISPYYEYIPTLSVCIIMMIFFSLSTFIHLGQAIRYRMYYLIATAVIAANTEVVGWGARLWSHYSPHNLTPFLIQTVTTLNAPTFLLAAYFVILAEIIRRLGPCYSRLRPMMYTVVFCSADFVALSIQGVGGGIAAVAAAGKKSPNQGAKIMLVGIIFQMIAITFYIILAVEFLYRYLNDKPFQRARQEPPSRSYRIDKNMKTMLFGIGLSSLLLYTRAIYRTIELTDGYSGRIVTTELYFNVLDGTMILCATWCLNIFHPGRLLGPPASLKTVNSY